MKTITKAALALVASLGFAAGAQASSVLLNGLGGSAGFGENSLARNDDGSTGFINVTSVFAGGLNFFGTTYNGFYINNNGNITFANPMGTYTPSAITGNTNNPMIAAFFADVDTRGGTVAPTAGGNSTGSNLLWWDFDTVANRMTITWDDVGYYSMHNSPLNAFQIVLTAMGDDGDFNIEFFYETIGWVTGDASGGSGGMGGTIARAGYTNGAGNYYELPQSGNQDGMLNLEGASNINDPGHFLWQVRNGTVVTPVAEPTAVFMMAIGLLGFAAARRRR